MADLIATQHPCDFYSVRIVDEGERRSVHCSFANQIDADRLAASVKATVVASHPSYRNQRVFVLDGEACVAICYLVRERDRTPRSSDRLHGHATSAPRRN